MTSPIDTMDGYIRAQAGLRLLDSAAAVASDDPAFGYLDLLTEDGRLRLTMTHNAAEDLLIDLQQFLSGRPPAVTG